MDYEDLNKECLFLASDFPNLFSYKYGYMTEELPDDGDGRRGAPFYKFGIKTFDDEFMFFVGFHDGGLSENVGFIDAFWVELFEWFTHSTSIIKNLDKDYQVSSMGEAFWLLSMQEIVKHKLGGNFVSRSVEDVIGLSEMNTTYNNKLVMLDSETDFNELEKLEGLSTEYIAKYVGSRVDKDLLKQNWMHVLKANGLI